MPTFDFACDKCGTEFEWFGSYSETASVACGVCEAKARRLYTGFNFTKEDKPFFSKAMGKMVDGNKDWKAKAKVRGWAEFLDPY